MAQYMKKPVGEFALGQWGWPPMGMAANGDGRQWGWPPMAWGWPPMLIMMIIDDDDECCS